MDEGRGMTVICCFLWSLVFCSLAACAQGKEVLVVSIYATRTHAHTPADARARTRACRLSQCVCLCVCVRSRMGARIYLLQYTEEKKELLLLFCGARTRRARVRV